MLTLYFSLCKRIYKLSYHSYTFNFLGHDELDHESNHLRFLVFTVPAPNIESVATTFQKIFQIGKRSIQTSWGTRGKSRSAADSPAELCLVSIAWYIKNICLLAAVATWMPQNKTCVWSRKERKLLSIKLKILYCWSQIYSLSKDLLISIKY